MWTLLKKILVTLLTLEARGVVKKYHPHIVAVTGSVGKTSTKDAIYAVLAASTYVRRSEKSFNSEVGLPLTILGVPNAWQNPLRWAQNLLDGLFLLLLKARYPRWLVLEVGADRPGDVKRVAKWLPVDVVVITRLPEVPVHVEYFDSPREVVEEKASLISSLKQGGTLVLYGDDEKVAVLRARAQGKSVITFGLSKNAEVRAEAVAVHLGEDGEPLGMQGRVVCGEESAPFIVRGAVGTHALQPFLAAAAVGKALGHGLEEVVKALGAYEPPQGRMRLVLGLKETLIIDDTYNSSPAAVEAALETLKHLPVKGRRVAVLGDMLELGRHSVEEHRKAGALAAKTGDLLFTVGFRARDMAQGALDAGMLDANIFQYEDARRAGKELEVMLKRGDVVLVKGSQSARMERAVEEIMAEPERAAELLVRQDPEWKRR
ncbi:UDP-N-acetylmuramoyl-tripeptide--D-alanyl-D-alanine ligase [Patescibacteria group bacterium]|nr:UDP-N-acetylmuramoyl-tripeptide--D-alanyl-D-alanine ligase [Patescibacteria group bacterium]